MPFDHLEGEVLQQLRNMMPITTRNPGKCKEVFTLLANNPPSNDYRKGAQWFEAFHITATKDFEALMESWLLSHPMPVDPAFLERMKKDILADLDELAQIEEILEAKRGRVAPRQKAMHGHEEAPHPLAAAMVSRRSLASSQPASFSLRGMVSRLLLGVVLSGLSSFQALEKAL
ncbi:hypothetical protein FOZ61_001079 [Perkinsus olseni]|uniref:Uncharacterized protein n=1 Tax=Perkinsus olseni TaxID=32597 RepID=A0A7J6LXY6_PEROL|nr:hypothetical protein FOZ61_001079 [Perkinsus olseni]